MPTCCHSEPLAKCHSGASSGGCSAGKHRSYHGSVYHAAPSAPTLEISINQHNPPSPCQSSGCAGYTSTPIPTPMISPAPKSQRPFRRPPDSPPPPPPVQQEYANPNYVLGNHNKRTTRNDRRESWRQLGRNASMRAVQAGNALRQKLYQKKNGVMFRVCLAELVLSGLLLAFGILCACKTREFCPYYSAIWSASVFLLNAGVGLIAAKLDTADFYVAHLVLSIVSFALSAIGAVLSAVNWTLIGTYMPTFGRGRQLMNPKADEEQMYRAFCLLGEHDAPRISYIYSHMDEYNFRSCLVGIKIGIAVNSLQFLLTIILGLLFIVSTILCLLRTCTSCSNGTNSVVNNKK